MIDRITRSIGGKLLLLVVAVAFFALSLSGVSLVIYEARTYHDRWVQDLDAQANILGLSSGAALAFNDVAAARQNLELLRTRPAILAAAIYDERGALFAGFLSSSSPGRDDGGERVPERIDAAADRVQVEGDRVLITKRIVEGSSYRGAVFLRATYGLGERVRNYAGILAAVMLASLAAAVVFATLLQKRITRPIVAVAETAHRVIDTRDFSLRVEKSTTDEIGYLVDAFNSMLSEIGARAQAIAAADRMKDQFLATLAHELRNPLAPISNALHILKMAKSRPELADPARAMMERQVRQLVRLVDDLLDISRITTGKLTLRTRPVRLRTILENAVEIARPLVDERHQVLVVDLDSADVELDVDETRLSQVFSNLLNNASKYTQEGGRIELRARVEGDGVEIDVIDNGIGMSPEHVQDMFRMFAQADTRIERASQSGLGVGLALARTLVQMHGGTIQGYSEGEARGSRFTVYLPLRAEPQRVVESAAVGEPPAGV